MSDDACMDPLEVRLANANRRANALAARVGDLEYAILVSHQTGAWGPVEDAYAAGEGKPALPHRHSDEELKRLIVEWVHEAFDCGAAFEHDSKAATEAWEKLKARMVPYVGELTP